MMNQDTGRRGCFAAAGQNKPCKETAMLIKNPPVAILDNLWMLGTNEYPLFLAKDGEEAAIFEGGVGAVGKLLREQLDALGVACDRVKQVAITHAHPDHVMAIPMFRALFPDVCVAASGVAAQTLAAEKAIAAFCDIDQALTGSLLKSGSIREEHRPDPLPEKQIAVDRLLKEGDAINVGSLSFQVLETPGHSDCSLSFHEPRLGVLIVSDATGFYLPDEHAWWPCYFGDYGKYTASIRRLAELGAEVLCLSHNAAIRGRDAVAAYFRDCLAATEVYHQRICERVRAGAAVRQLAEELGNEVYAKAPLLPPVFFQKNCGILVKHSLRHENIAVDK
jgi:glyoxylase-like metal-dependent hydrolase (beta-lactamase superfamily II)